MSKKLVPEDFVEIFDLAGDKPAFRDECRPLTIWLPKECKAKYDLVQARSRKTFGKFIRKVIEKSIDKVDIDKAA